MKVLMNVSLDELDSKINRKIEVDDNIGLDELCEYIIISMNGTKIPFYSLDYENETYFLNENYESDEHKLLTELTLKDLKIEKGSELGIEYNFEQYYYFNIKVDDIYESNSDKETSNFEVLSGKGVGLIDSISIIFLKSLVNNSRRKKTASYYSTEERKYMEQSFDCNEVNNKIKEYKKQREYLQLPKRYIFNVTLDEFNKEIKRKIVVNSNIKIDDFCEHIIRSMNGDLSHCYCIKRNKEYLDEHYNNVELYCLDLKKKQRLKIIYDWGDNWIFNLTVSKIIEDYSEYEFEVLSGKGYGIIDDCGGPWGLEQIFNGNNEDWGKYDINEFDLEKCNEKVRY